MGDSRNVINARRHINIRDAAINCGLLIFHITYMYLTTDVCTELTPFDSQPLRPRIVIQHIELDSRQLHIARDLAVAWSANPTLGLQYYLPLPNIAYANIYANRCN